LEFFCQKRNSNSKSKWLCRFSIAIIEFKNVFYSKIARFLYWVFSLSWNIQGWLKFCGSYMVYSQIWLNLLMDHFQYFYIGMNLWKMVATFGKEKNSNKSHCQVHNFLELQCLALRERMQSVCSLYSCKYEPCKFKLCMLKMIHHGHHPRVINVVQLLITHGIAWRKEGGGYTDTLLDKLYHSLVFSHT
jgi:hypothetical protein